jgi:prophage DNA circulation protein
MATKKLSAKLLPASFRGIPFNVEDTDLGAGRRTQVHEYPQRDKPYTEDMGRATRDLSFSAFLVGADYVEQANKLLGALEQSGSGTLVHPWFGSMQVSLVDKARVSFDSSLGRARVQMQFVEAGELAFPMATSSTGAATRLAADKLSKASIDSFAAKFGIKGFQDWVSAAANGQLLDKLGIVSTSEINKVLGFSNGLAKTFSTLSGLISNPRSLGTKLMGMFGLSGLTTSLIAWKNVVKSFSRIGKSPALKDKPSSIVFTPSRKQAQANATALNAITRQALLVQAVGASSLVGTESDAEASTTSYADMLEVRDTLLSAIDEEMLVADDTVYVALQEARAAVWTDMTTRARDSSRIKSLTPKQIQPALVLAYDQYGDASRDAEIITRNNIRHPGFVPAKPISLLTQ